MAEEVAEGGESVSVPTKRIRCGGFRRRRQRSRLCVCYEVEHSQRERYGLLSVAAVLLFVTAIKEP